VKIAGREKTELRSPRKFHGHVPGEKRLLVHRIGKVEQEEIGLTSEKSASSADADAKDIKIAFPDGCRKAGPRSIMVVEWHPRGPSMINVMEIS